MHLISVHCAAYWIHRGESSHVWSTDHRPTTTATILTLTLIHFFFSLLVKIIRLTDTSSSSSFHTSVESVMNYHKDSTDCEYASKVLLGKEGNQDEHPDRHVL